MSVAATHWAKGQIAGGTTAKAVLLVLADYADEEGSCWPGQRTIATEAECGRRSVQRALDELVQRGLVTIKPHFVDTPAGAKRQTSNRYHLALPPGQSDQGAVANLATRGRHSGHPGGVTVAHQEPPEEPPLRTPSARARRKPPTDGPNPAATAAAMARNRGRRQGDPACSLCDDSGVRDTGSGFVDCECKDAIAS